MASRKYIERRREIARIKSRKGVEARERKRMDQAATVWELVRVIDIKRADGTIATTWRVFATHNPEWPLSVDFGGKLHRFMSIRRLSPLIARKMFEVANG